jgi:hypothetical protein
MELNIYVNKADDDVSAHVEEVPGFVIVSDNVKQLKQEIIPALKFHAGQDADDPLNQHSWQLKWHYDIPALIDCYSGILNQSNLARIANVNPSVMRQYIAGVRNPSAKKMRHIQQNIQAFAQNLADINLIY